MEETEKDHKFYYFSDMTGFGKTMSLMALIYRTNDRWISNDRLFYNPNITLSSDQRKIKLRDLYITPLHLFSQVCSEAKRCGMKFIHIKSYNGCIQNEYADDVDLIIISCTMVDTYLRHSHCVPFYRVIIDEADTVNFRSKSAPLPYAMYRHLVLVSATLGPYSENEETEWRCYRLIRPEYDLNRIESSNILPKTPVKFIQIKNRSEDIIDYFKANFEVEEFVYKHKLSKLINIVSKYAPDTAGYALSIGDINSAVRIINNRTRNSGVHNIGTIMLGYLEERLKTSKYDQESIRRRIENLKTDMAELKNEPCIICLSPIERCTVTPCCQHLMCSECILQWISNQKEKRSCPLCRSPMDVEHLHVVDLSYTEENEEVKLVENKPRDHFTKMTTIQEVKTNMGETVREILTRYPNGKYLVYTKLSHYDNKDGFIKNIIRGIPGINATDLPSGVTMSTSTINKFHKGAVNCLFLNYEQEATGLNCQETTDILVLGQTTEANIVQMRGRALRLGRTEKVLRMHFLISDQIL
jgi:hypothetical protein